jgi:phosphohistidine phosphatase
MEGMSHPSASASPIQRRISLLRHAEAMPERGGDDSERPLSEAGRAQAAALGVWLREQALAPQFVACSTALRTRETLALLQLDAPVDYRASLYLASAGDMLAQLQQLDASVQHVLLIAHNPGMHGLAALLAGEYAREADADQLVGRYPTCGFVSMSFMGDWAPLAPQAATLDLLRFTAGY